MNTLLSIVVPVYNVQSYLGRCVESLIANSRNDVEIILVDDGSTDNSLRLCKEYEQQDARVHCFHKQNGGLSDARNYGISKSEGEYIWFIDSDDYVSQNAVNEVVDDIIKKNSDVLVYRSYVAEDTGDVYEERKGGISEGIYSSNEYMNKMKNHPNSIILCAQYHVFSRKLIEKNKISFYEGIIHEDELWTPQLLLNAESIYYANKLIYYHFMRVDSIMHSVNYEKSGKSDLIVATELSRIYDESGRNDLQYLRDHMADTFMQAIWKIPNFISNKDEIQRNFPIKNAFYNKTRLKAILYWISPKMYLKIHNISNQNCNCNLNS